MALSIEQLRSAFTKKSETQNTGFWDKFYPFYKMQTDEMANIRFLPDRNEENPLGFIVENKYHELTINGQKKKVACLKMFGESCPICEESAKHYNEGSTDLGKKYYRKIDYIGQALINSSPFDYPIKEEDNPIRLVSMGPMLFKKIEAAFKSGDLDANPTDMVGGYDFRIIKTKKGEYADYSTSDFARKSSDIPEDVLAVLDLYDLQNYRFSKVERDVLEAMLEADKTGASMETPSSSPSSQDSNSHSQEAQKPQEKASGETPSPTPSATPASGKPSADDILAKIRARAAAKTSE